MTSVIQPLYYSDHHPVAFRILIPVKQRQAEARLSLLWVLAAARERKDSRERGKQRRLRREAEEA